MIKMALDDSVSMEPVKEKLRNLKEYLPNQPEFIYKFASFLADRLNPDLVPAGFNLGVEIVLDEIETGIDAYTGKPLRNSLVGYPSTVYAGLRMYIPNIVKAVCPEDFANKVIKVQEIVSARLREQA